MYCRRRRDGGSAWLCGRSDRGGYRCSSSRSDSCGCGLPACGRGRGIAWPWQFPTKCRKRGLIINAWRLLTRRLRYTEIAHVEAEFLGVADTQRERAKSVIEAAVHIATVWRVILGHSHKRAMPGFAAYQASVRPTAPHRAACTKRMIEA